MSTIGCVIPAFNVATLLPPVLEAVRISMPGALLVVVDDGSHDATGAVAAAGADQVIRHDNNRGKGASLRSGITIAMQSGCDVIVTMDGDGQHSPAEAPALVRALASADVAVGARQRAGTGMPLQRRVSNRLSSAVVSALAGVPIADSQSGFRAIRSEVLRQVQLRGDRYEQETDFIVRAARAGFRIVSVPVVTLYGPTSNFRPLRDTALVIRTMVRLGFAHSH